MNKLKKKINKQKQNPTLLKIIRKLLETKTLDLVLSKNSITTDNVNILKDVRKFGFTQIMEKEI